MLNRVIQDMSELFAELQSDMELLKANPLFQEKPRYQERLESIFQSVHTVMGEVASQNRQLEELNRRLTQANEVIEKSNVVVFEWTLDIYVPTKFVTDNVSQFGYRAEDFYEGELKDYWNFIHPDDREASQKLVYEMRKQKCTDYRHRYRVTCRDGSTRWVEENAILDYNEQGRAVREQGILYDITESVEMHNRLKSSEERYRSLFDRAPAIMLTMDSTGHITSANQYCQDFFHYNEEKLKRMRLKDLMAEHGDMGGQFNDLWETVCRLAGTPIELDVRTKELRTLTIQMTLDAISKEGSPVEIQAIAQDVTKKKAIDEKVRYLSYHDKLTGLFNRAWFDEQIKILEAEERYPYTVVIGDMNGLKVANDLFGHKTGDTLLAVTAEILRRCCRDSDVISRLGGDEFAILLPNSGEEVAREVCQRIRNACDATRMKPLNPSIALGYATRKDAQDSLEELMKEADDRMYRNKLNVSSSLRSSLIMSLQASLEEKTLETKAHAERIRTTALAVGRKLELSENLQDQLSLASVMHDIGKIGIPDSILTKPGKLTEDEWNVMKKHCEIGHNILNTSTNMQAVGEFILHHHERWDGNGYPKGLKNDEIPLLSRIIAVVDAFDVMCHNRVYSRAKTAEEAVHELQCCSGTQFDPSIVAVFCEMVVNQELDTESDIC